MEEWIILILSIIFVLWHYFIFRQSINTESRAKERARLLRARVSVLISSVCLRIVFETCLFC